jgi:contact-dependent growth inhibition (CDI) system CdiI-like immunity protein
MVSLEMDDTKTLQQLDGETWGEPTYDSNLVQTVHALRRKPIADFTVEDLRIMLGQQIGLPHLMPHALVHLERDPVVSGDFYPGDLLGVVMGVDRDYWRGHPTEARRMSAVAEHAKRLLDDQGKTDEIKTYLRQLIADRRWAS